MGYLQSKLAPRPSAPNTRPPPPAPRPTGLADESSGPVSYVGRNLRTGLVCKLSLVCRLGETLAQFAYRVSVCKSNDVIAQYADWLPNYTCLTVACIHNC